jgi:MerR family transcriptional regulator, thiopeptide resistance regulator
MNRLNFTIAKLARAFGLSRSALLYYDRIGLFRPAGRTAAGYRYYTEKDRRQLQRICELRSAGLKLKDIQTVLSAPASRKSSVLDHRIREVRAQIRVLKIQHRLLWAMHESMITGKESPAVDKALWVAMLQAAGMDEAALIRWHAEFEHRAPEAHHEFLASLGIPEEEIVSVRQWSRASEKKDRAEARSL